MAISPSVNAKATAAINRLHAAQVANPRYLQVMKNTAQEDAGIQVEVHVHDGPQGVGYTVYCEAVDAGVTYRRAHGAGAHSQTHDWSERKARPL